MKDIDKKLNFSYKKKIFLNKKNNDENIKNTTFSFQIINNFNYDIKSKENLIKELENTILLLKKQISNFNNFQITKNLNFEILNDNNNINLNEAKKIIQNQQNKIEQLNLKLKKSNENIKYLNEKLNNYQKEE
jgi:predicted RNase H-like nuclease (RuvC/YqgF family)